MYGFQKLKLSSKRTNNYNRIQATMENKIHIPGLSFPVRFDDKATLKAFTLVCITCFMYIVVSEWWTLLFFLDTLDKQLMILLNYTGGRFADRFWYAYSQKFIWTPLVLLTLLSLFVNQKGPLSHKLLLVVAVVLMVAVLDQFSSSLIKPLVARLRPSHTPLVANMLHYVNDYHGGKFGFVSGHATNTVGIAVFLGLIYHSRLIRWSLFFFALFMCYSRIYLGVHYPGDIICGSLMGALGTWATVCLLRRRHLAMPTDQCPWAIVGAFYVTVLGIVIYACCPVVS